MKQDWRTKGSKSTIAKRHVIYEEFQKLVSYYEWNTNNEEDVRVQQQQTGDR